MARSMSVVSTDQKNFLAMGAVGSSHEATTLPSVVCAVAASNSSVERIIQANLPSHGGSSSSNSATSASGASLSWNANSGAAPPSDWVQLQNAGKCSHSDWVQLHNAGKCSHSDWVQLHNTSKRSNSA